MLMSDWSSDVCSSDLYALALDTNYLIVRDIPYLNVAGELKWGALAAKLVFEDDVIVRPEDHQVFWSALRPYGLDGQLICGLGGGEAQLSLRELCSDVVIQQRFSHKLTQDGQARAYIDHLEKIERYVTMTHGKASV